MSAMREWRVRRPKAHLEKEIPACAGITSLRPAVGCGSGDGLLLARDEGAEAGGDEGDDEEDDGRGHERHKDQAALPEFPTGRESADDRGIYNDNGIDREGHEEGHTGTGGKGHVNLMKRYVSLCIETSRFVQVFSSGFF